MRATTAAGDTQAQAVGEAPPGAIRVRGLRRSFGAAVALAATDLDVGPGGITGLLGPNGSGKSTLLRCIVGLVPADAGRVWVDGLRLRGDGVGIRRRCTFTPGELALYGRMRARDQLDWLVAGHGREARERARALAEDFALPLRQRVRTYSHGMKRQLLFAAALAPRVPVRFLDEITEGLDPSKRGAVLEKLREDEREGTTILLSSHHLGEVQRVCDRMIFMQGGKKLSEENAASVLARSRRLVRLRFDHAADLGELRRAALAAGALDVRGDAQHLVLHLAEDDLRPLLRRLLDDPAFPRPLGVEYGELSLEDLYAELYGEAAC
jgi:ABC-2 type transport system ATP-binding protein